MERPRWFQPTKPTSPRAEPDTEPPPDSYLPEGIWLTDADVRGRLHTAVLMWLEDAERAMDEGATLADALTEVRSHAVEGLGIPAPYVLLVEAEAVAHVVEQADGRVGSVFGPYLAASLERLLTEGTSEHQRLALRRATSLSSVLREAESQHTKTARGTTRSLPSPGTIPRPPGRSR
ncbi:hypothetical protein ACQPZG_31915 [Streptomyces sp. CA-294286]|uniref:hypothetical protein n=1 Tax=Streptomyces sp. CA-294286 TaxID=3240070 RepID=UPI003D8F8515